MEIKKRLQKPYTEKERINFIVQQNHRNGFEIRETDEELQAWGYTAEETAEQYRQNKIAEINRKIEELQQQRTYRLKNVKMLRKLPKKQDKIAC